MGLFKKFRNKHTTEVNTNEDFWIWFVENEKSFFKTVRERQQIERDFLDQLAQKLDKLIGGYNFLTGMYDEKTAELIITADGVVKHIVFVEELIQAAPSIDGWKFTASKPALPKSHQGIILEDMPFDPSNLNFYSNDNTNRPDEINITVVYDNYKEELKDPISSGVFIFLDNFLGELAVVTDIDFVYIIGPDKIEKELIPIEKLKDFIIWRQKEFVEKYEGTLYNTENDKYHSLEATLENGKPLIAIINTTLLEWDRKASHPWILILEINYEGNEYGMPNDQYYEIMDQFEDELMERLKTEQGYLNVGRETADGLRKVYFACKDFRAPSKVTAEIRFKYQDKLKVEYNIYKDKYWQTFNQFKPTI